jgi:cbb3-type cytochrome oxidase subunit 3
MKSQVLAQFPMIWLSVVGLMIFVIVFSGVSLMTFRRGNREQFEKAAFLPLNDEAENEG